MLRELYIDSEEFQLIEGGVLSYIFVPITKQQYEMCDYLILEEVEHKKRNAVVSTKRCMTVRVLHRQFGEPIEEGNALLSIRPVAQCMRLV